MKKIIKRIAALALAALLIVSVFAGCSSTKTAQIGLLYCSAAAAEAEKKHKEEKRRIKPKR